MSGGFRAAARVARFVVFAGVGTVLDLVVLLSLRRAGLPLLLCVFFGFSASQVSGFLLNRKFVFTGGRSSLLGSSWRYGVLVAINLAVGVGGVTWIVSQGADYLVTRVVVSALLVLFNFAVAHLWVFRSGSVSSLVEHVVPAQGPGPGQVR